MQFYEVPTREDYVEFGMATAYVTLPSIFSKSRKILFRLFLILPIVCVVLCALLYMLTGNGTQAISIFLLVCALSLVGIGLQYLTRLVIKWQYTSLFKKQVGGVHTTIEENGVAFVSDDKSQQGFYAWSQVDKALVTPNLYIFILKNGTGIFLNKKVLVGQEALFLQLLQTYLPGVPLQKGELL